MLCNESSHHESSDESSDLVNLSSEDQVAVLHVPHHLKSKAAGANSVKKAARILAVGLFTVKERCSCTVSGASNKSKEDTKRPKFDIQRMTLIHGKCFLELLLYERTKGIFNQFLVPKNRRPQNQSKLRIF